MCHARGVSYDTVVWLPNALIMTGVLGAFAGWRWRRKGVLSGLRWTGVAMLPLALYGIGAFRLAWSVGLALSRFVTGFVWRPSVWLGLLFGAVAVMLIMVPPKLDKRLGGSKSESTPKRVTGSKGKAAPVDNDMADIEDILKKHGLG
jgi:hypothetical protein